MNQALEALKRLRKGCRLTPIDALKEFGCFRLSARIKELRNYGYDIETHRVRTRSGKNVAGYELIYR